MITPQEPAGFRKQVVIELPGGIRYRRDRLNRAWNSPGPAGPHLKAAP